MPGDVTTEPRPFPPGPTPSDNGRGRAKPTIDERLTHRAGRWPALLAGLALGVGATIAVTLWTGRDTGADDVVLDEVVTLDTAAVEQRNLIEEVDWTGTLAAGTASSVASPVEGTITAVAEVGAAIGRGDVIARVDDRPVVVVLGATPMWRDLGVGDEGADVLQLETNLAALGFDPDGAVTIDDEYTAATAEMVEAWQESLGVDDTGEVVVGDIVVLTGESMMAASPAVGSSVQTGATLAEVETGSVQLDVVGRAREINDTAGDALDAVADVGTTVSHGTVLYTAGGVDVAAVSVSDPAIAAVVDAITTGDIEALESMLAFFGHDPDGEIEIDVDADLAPVAAIARWQQAAGLPTTGSVDAADYVALTAEKRYVVAEVTAAVGDEIGEGMVVMTLASPTLALTADIAITEVDEFTVGDEVTVEQVDETTFGAVVTAIADTSTESADGSRTVQVTFEVTEQPAEFVSGSVTVTTESSRIDGATVVPTRALVTLREGGFAVERSEPDGTTTLVGVELGTFDDGVVEITAGDLSPGDLVVVPS